VAARDRDDRAERAIVDDVVKGRPGEDDPLFEGLELEPGFLVRSFGGRGSGTESPNQARKGRADHQKHACGGGSPVASRDWRADQGSPHGQLRKDKNLPFRVKLRSGKESSDESHQRQSLFN
jgi:hypothetical protein